MVPSQDQDLLNDANINLNTLHKDTNHNYIIDDIDDKLNVIGAHFARINNNNSDPNKRLGRDRFDTFVHKKKPRYLQRK